MAKGKTWVISVPIKKSGSTYGYIRVYFEESYDQSGNYSTLKVTKMTGSNSLRAGVFQSSGSISIDGSTWYSWSSGDWQFAGLEGDCEFATYSGEKYPSGRKINHNDDGKKTIAVAVKVSSYYGVDADWTGTGGTVTQNVDLTTIARASSVTATDANIEAVSTITVVKKAEAYTHSIKYEFGELSGYINADGTVSAEEVKLSETSIGFTVPADFYSQIPNEKNGVCTLTVVTYSGDTQVGNAIPCQFTVTAAEASCAPLVSGTVMDANIKTQELTGDANVLVRYASEAVLTLTAIAQHGSTIMEKYIAGKEVTSDLLLIPAVDTNSFFFRAVDSRGYAATATVVKDMVPYIRLTNNSEGNRTDATSGLGALVIKGNFFNNSFGAVDNELTARYRINCISKEGNMTITRIGEWVDATELVEAMDNNTYKGVIPLEDLDYRNIYNIDVEVSDKVTEAVLKTVTINKGEPVLFWTDEMLRVYGDLKVKKDVTVGGALSVGDAETTRTNLGLGAVATESVLPIEKGGTGASDAETARANLGIGNAKANPVLLWTNPNPSSNYSAQKVLLDLTEYRGVSFYYRNQSSGTYYKSSGFFAVGDSFELDYSSTAGGASIRKGIVLTDGIDFEAATTGLSGVSAASAIVPIKIYGWR